MATESWVLTASHRRYPWAVPIGVEAAIAASGDYLQYWNSSEAEAFSVQPGSSVRTINSGYTENWRYFHQVSGSVSAGWGRVRNATGIYDAVVLEQRLRATGALTRPLSTSARRRLADLLYARGGLDSVRERPGRALWREIEHILSDDGALGDNGFDPFSVLRGEEPHLGETVR